MLDKRGMPAGREHRERPQRSQMPQKPSNRMMLTFWPEHVKALVEHHGGLMVTSPWSPPHAELQSIAID